MKKRRLTRKKLGIFIAGLLLTGLVFGAVFAQQGSGRATAANGLVDNLGPFTHYNGIIFDTFETYSADAEGAVAIGGKAKLGTGWGQFDFGATAHGQYGSVAMGNYENPFGYPTVLLNEVPEITSQWHTVSAYGGPVVLRESLKSAYTSGNMINGTTLYASDENVQTFFDEAYTETVRVGELFVNGNTNTAATVDFSKVNLDWAFFSAAQYYNNGDYTVYHPDNISDYGDTGITSDRIAVINMEAGARVDIKGIQLPKNMGDQFDLIVFNFPDTIDVTFTSNSVMLDGTGFLTSDPRNKTVEEYAGKIIWNFPAAETIQTKWCGIVGSVIAPNADVDANGGSINGMLVSNSLKTVNGFELHAFYIRRNIYEFGKDDGTGDVELTKKDGNGTDAGLLEGAEFTLYVKMNSGEYVQLGTNTYTTDRYGKIRLENLQLGDYYFQEVNAPDGYDMDPDHSDGRYYFTIAKKDAVVEVEAVNIEKTTSLKLVKKDDSDENILLEGARFALYRSHKTTSGKLNMELMETELTTDIDGLLEIEDLTPGYYYLVEYQAPEGYQLDTYNLYQFLVELKDGDPVVAANSFYKLNAEIDDLDLNDPERQVDNDPNVEKVQIPVEKNTVIIENHKIPDIKGGFTLLKKDSDTEDTLGGAVFTLFNDDGEKVAEYTTNAFGRIDVDDLEPGAYKLKETKPPEGYRFAEGEEIHEFEIEGTVDGRHHFYFDVENNPLTHDVTFSKVDSREPEKKLSGAEFVLFKSTKADDGTLNLTQVNAGTAGGTIVSGSNGEVALAGLYAGTYYLLETEAPEGYKTPVGVAYQIQVEIDGDQLKHTVNKLTFEDPDMFDLSDLSGIENSTEGVTVEPLGDDGLQIQNEKYVFGRVTIQKIDEETNIPLEGARFVLESESGEKYGLETNWLGYASIENMPLGQYTLIESTAPKGYDKDSIKISYTNEDGENIEVDSNRNSFKLTEEDCSFTFVVTNRKLTIDHNFTKVDADDETNTLNGAEFVLYKSQKDTSGELYFEHVAKVESKDSGNIKLSGLSEGYYYLVETKAPDGYELPVDRVIQIRVQLDSSGENLTVNSYLLNLNEGAVISALEASINSKDEISDKIIKNEKIPEDPDPNDPDPEEPEDPDPNDPDPEEPEDPDPNDPDPEEPEDPDPNDPDPGDPGDPEPDETGEIHLQKVDKDTGEPLSGVTFRLTGDGYDEERTTNIFGQIHFTELKPGTYTLTEEKGLNGYKQNSIEYDLNNSDISKNGTALEITVGKNDPLYYSITATNQKEVVQTPRAATMTLTKFDGVNQIGVANADFLVYESLGSKDRMAAGSSDSVVLRFKEIVTSQEDGTIEIDGVTETYYYVAEVEAPESYEPTVDVIQTKVVEIDESTNVVDEKEVYLLQVDPSQVNVDLITQVEGSEVQEKTAIDDELILNYPILGSITLWKYVEGSYELLPEAEFILSRETDKGWEEVGTYITNRSGYLHIAGLELGTYRLAESDGWSGGHYVLDSAMSSEDLEFELTLGNPELTLKVNNKKRSFDEEIHFIKVDESGDALAGAKFNLYKASQSADGNYLDFTFVEDYETGADGLIRLNDLEEGNYYLAEIEPPEGYWIESTYKVYQIRVIWDDKEGDYKTTIYEVPILQEYDLNNLKGIFNDKSLELLDVDQDENDNYIIINEEEPDFFGNAALMKIDANGDTPLSGAKFKLSRLIEGGDLEQDSDWKTLGTQVTDVFGKITIDRLKAGTYKVEEVEAPQGYQTSLVEPVIFVIAEKEDQKAEYLTGPYVYLEVENKEIPGNITVEKRSYKEQDTDEEEVLEGVEFSLYYWQYEPLQADTNENSRSEISSMIFTAVPRFIGSYTTNKEDKIVIENLSQGWYTLVESGKPKGYDASYTRYYDADGNLLNADGDEVSFEITGTGDKYEIEFTAKNKALTGDVTVVKVDADSVAAGEEENQEIIYLADVTFDLYQLNAGRQEVPYQKGLKTDETGTLTIEDLPLGRYVLYETENPNAGYILEEDFYIMFTVAADQTSTQVIDTGAIYVTNQKEEKENAIDLNIRKVRDDRQEEVLGGAVFYLYQADNDKEPLQKVTTREDGSAQFTGITAGDYLLREMQAPIGFETGEESSRDIAFSVVEVNSGLKIQSESDGFAYDKDGEAWITIGNTYVDHLPDVSLVKRDKDNDEALQGAEFNVYYAPDDLDRADKEDITQYNFYVKVKSDSTGEIVFPYMEEGYYYMEEVRAPEGYVIDTDTGTGTGRYFFHIAYDEDGKLEMDLNNRIYREGEDNEEIRIYNRKEKPGQTEPQTEPQTSEESESTDESQSESDETDETDEQTKTKKADQTDKGNGKANKAGKKAPRTGEENYMEIYILFSVLSAAMVSLLILARKQRK